MLEVNGLNRNRMAKSTDTFDPYKAITLFGCKFMASVGLSQVAVSACGNFNSNSLTLCNQSVGSRRVASVSNVNPIKSMRDILKV